LSPPASPSSSPSSSRPVIPSGPPTLPVSPHTPTPSPLRSSVATTTSSTSTESGSETTQIPDLEDDDCTEDVNENTETSTSATDPGATQTTSSHTLPATTTVPLTTSTVTVTEVHTLTACPSFVRDCPASEQTTYVTTETIDIYTTICPVTATETSAPDAQITTQAPLPEHEITISTVYQTSVYTIIACPLSVPNCSAQQQTTYLSTEMLPSYATVTLIPLEVPTPTAADASETGTGSGSNGIETEGGLPDSSSSQQAHPTFTTSVASSSSAAAVPASSSHGQTASDTSSAVGSVFTGAASVLSLQPGYAQIAVGLLGLAAVALI
jgi:chitinase